jgi:hypothetical protein
VFDWLSRLIGFDNLVDIDFDIFPVWEEGKPWIPGFEVENTHKVLPESKTISGTFSRWHNKDIAPPAVPLWRSFLDDDRKWASQGRFAGSDKNCGHFFALAERVATSEAKHYGVDLRKCIMLEVEAHLEKVLDLTTPSGRKLAFDAVVEDHDFNDPFIAEEISEPVTSGTVLTDRIGLWALYERYHAILYLAPRLLWEPGTVPKGNNRAIKPFDYDLFARSEQSYRNGLELNLVVFKGVYLMSRIENYRTDGRKWTKNELFGLSEDEIEIRLSTDPDYAKFGEDYQISRRVFALGKIKYSETP